MDRFSTGIKSRITRLSLVVVAALLLLAAAAACCCCCCCLLLLLLLQGCQTCHYHCYRTAAAAAESYTPAVPAVCLTTGVPHLIPVLPSKTRERPWLFRSS